MLLKKIVKILERINNGHLFAFDQDGEAISYSKKILDQISNNYEIINSNFVNLRDELHKRGVRVGLQTNIKDGILPHETHYQDFKNFLEYKDEGIIFIDPLNPKNLDALLKFGLQPLEEFGVDLKKLNDMTIHIHIPEGAIQKEGPSAGVALTTVLLSLFTNMKVSSRISMTGEITLTGRVLPIGGLKEKVIGAHRAFVNKIFIPRENEKDLKEIPQNIKDDIEFVLVDTYLDIFKELGGKKRGNKRSNKKSKSSK